MENNKSVDTEKSVLNFKEKYFMEPDEQFVTALGNNYISNYISEGKAEKGFVVVSDKRVYFKGLSYTFNNRKLKKNYEERVVDLHDITGTGYKRVEKKYLQIIAYVFLAISACAMIDGFFVSKWFLKDIGEGVANIAFYGVLVAIPYISYLESKKNMFEISFAGGCISFNSAWYDKESVDDFQKTMRIAKDKVIKKKEKRSDAGNNIGHTTKISNAADDLLKYSQLLKDGLITKEEFDSVKLTLLKEE